MKALLIIALFALCGLSYQLTSQQIIQAVNRARVRPSYYADKIRAQYTSKGIRGTANDPNCYAEAESALRAQAPLQPLKESIVADLAAWRHSNWMRSTKIFSHTGVNGSNPKARLDAVGVWPSAAYSYNENIAWSSNVQSAEFYVIMWLTDCGILSRGHRKNILSTSVSFQGCGDSGNYITCVGTASINLKPTITAADLTAAALSRTTNVGGYTGV